MVETLNQTDEKIVVSFESSLGLVKIEGAEAVVTRSLAELMKSLKTADTSATQVAVASNTGTGGRAKKPKRKQVYPIFITQLIPKDKLESLTSFIDSKKAKAHVEIYACAALWLKENLGITKFSVSEMYTVYKILNKKPPKDLTQIFRNAKQAKGAFEHHEETGFYTLTILGERYAEHELPANGGIDGD